MDEKGEASWSWTPTLPPKPNWGLGFPLPKSPRPLGHLYKAPPLLFGDTQIDTSSLKFRFFLVGLEGRDPLQLDLDLDLYLSPFHVLRSPSSYTPVVLFAWMAKPY